MPAQAVGGEVDDGDLLPGTTSKGAGTPAGDENAVICIGAYVCSGTHVVDEQTDVAQRMVFALARGAHNGDMALALLQQIIDSGKIGPKKKDEWLAIGITICTILANEVDGMEWKTLIDGNREAPVLQYKNGIIDPMKLTWSRIKAGESCNVIETYKSALTAD